MLAIQEIESKIHYIFKDKKLLALAFVHRSFVNEHRQIEEHNERLEFLGDSILGLIVSEYLYVHFPHTDEGELSHLRARLIEATSCVKYIQKLELSPYLLLGRGEKMNDGRGRGSILADLFEALIGAIYLDGGYSAAQQFFFLNFSEDISKIIEHPIRNWKAELQDFSQKKYQQPPLYQVIEEQGPSHNKVFAVSVLVDGKEMGKGMGASKKEAQQAAAAVALEKITEL